MFDTRRKIVTAEARQPGVVVTGYFDPLTAAHVRRLLEISAVEGPLTVVVHDPEAPVLVRQARAELVAALECVETVIACESGEVDGWLAKWQAKRYAEEDSDRQRFEALVEHVRNRQHAK